MVDTRGPETVTTAEGNTATMDSRTAARSPKWLTMLPAALTASVAVVPFSAVTGLVEKLKTQKGIVIDQQTVPGANHFFDGRTEELMEVVGAYLDKRLPDTAKKTSAA